MTAQRLRIAMASFVIAGTCLALAGRPSAQRGGQQGGEMGGVGITIFADSNFRGLNSNFRTEVPDLRKFGMNDRVDSLRIPRGEIWEVCEDINFKGRCQTFSGDESDLNRVAWGGMISSLRPVRDNGRDSGRGRQDRFPPPPPQRPRLVLFSEVDFRGQSIVIWDNTPLLRGFNDRAMSAKVYGGIWQICEDADFWGRCEMLMGSVPDLGRLGFRDRISSARIRPR